MDSARVILFGLPKTKDAARSSALDPDGPVPRNGGNEDMRRPASS